MLLGGEVIMMIGGAEAVLGMTIMMIVGADTTSVGVEAARGAAVGTFTKVGIQIRTASLIMLVDSVFRIISYIVATTTGISWNATVRIRTAIGGARKWKCGEESFCCLQLHLRAAICVACQVCLCIHLTDSLCAKCASSTFV